MNNRLNDLIESIRLQEARAVDQLDEEYIKRCLFHLELKSKLNERKLKKLLHEAGGLDEAELHREAELNEFLRAQIDFYRRKLDTSRRKLTSIEREHDQLVLDYQKLLHLANSSERSPRGAGGGIQSAYDEAQRQNEVNQAKLNYLDATISSLDDSLSQKHELFARLNNELESIVDDEPPTMTTTTTDTIMSSEASSSSSSSEEAGESSCESISNMLSDASAARHKSPASPSPTPLEKLPCEKDRIASTTRRRRGMIKSASRWKSSQAVATNDNLEDIYFF